MRKFLILIAIAFLTNESISISLSDCNSKSSTICSLANQTRACCFVKDATCCSNSEFCCPKGFECDVANNRCLKESLYIPFHLMMEAITDDVAHVGKVGKDILCPDNETMCKESQTCCNLTDGNYGCCPIKNAICCEDKVHCCPHNYKCNPTQGKCDRKDANELSFLLESINWHEKVSGTKRKPADKETNPGVSIECPGGSAECPSGTTCCQITATDWGCCPLPDAVCCEDKIHCCPHDYTCDVKDGRCNKADESLPLFKKLASTPKIKGQVVCPDGKSECPQGSTCCQLSSGEYGCCPLPEATCCSDHLHCCPKGYTCDVADGRCNKGSISIPFFRKIISSEKKKDETQIVNPNFDSNSVVCPDGCSFCPNGNTCCKISDGSYGCCPLPQAVCCEDHLHCCPRNTHCNVERQTCENDEENEIESIVSSWYQKTPAKLLYHEKDKKNNVANDPVICEDKVTTCDPLKVCCKMADGTYGCCSYSDGVCCTNLSYCCPGGTTCGSVIGECIPTNINSNKWHTIELKAEEIKIENNLKSCPECVYKNGTCCGSEGLCCPSGYTCNDKDESCTLNDPDMIKTTKIVKINRLYDSLSSVQCADSIHFCPDASTCCKTSTADGSFGCCPVKDAVCCADGVNCCPTGYKCVANSQVACVKQN